MARQQRAPTRRPARRATVASVLGELLLTAGVLALGYAGWQVWLSDAVLGSEQQQAAQVFASQLGPVEPAPSTVGLRTDEPPAEAAAPEGESFAVMHIPRLGQFQRVVGEGTSRSVLDSLEQGLAHYSASAQPGELGNFAVAASYNQASQANLRRRGASIGGTATFGATSVTLDLTRDTKNEWTGKKYTNGVVEAKYALSKRTFVYGAFLRYDGDNNYGIGVRHNF